MKQFFYSLWRFILPLVIWSLTLPHLAALATGVYDLPTLKAGSPTWIIDQAEVISLSNEGQISNQLSKLAQTTGDEVRLVSIRRLDYGMTIDGLADELFSHWFPTDQEKANQVLLVLDTLSNKTALRVGEKVKDRLTPELIESITDKTIAIPLREGSKYNEAFLDASYRISQVVSGQDDPGEPTKQEINIEGTFKTAEATNDRSATVWVIVLLVVATAIPMATYFWYVGLGR